MMQAFGVLGWYGTIADKWIEVMKHSDYDWGMADITHTMTNRCGMWRLGQKQGSQRVWGLIWARGGDLGGRWEMRTMGVR
jgi:hypothetical protein